MKIEGHFQPPGDKSISHRIGLLSLLAGGRCQVKGYSPCADCASTLAAVCTLGGKPETTTHGVRLNGCEGRIVASAEVDCGNSGTTLRLLMGILAGSPGSYLLGGDESLRRRPMERVAAPLREMGAIVECTEDRHPVRVKGGGLHGITYRLPVASAQLKSALLLAGLQAEGTTTVAEPAPSRDHTERLLAMTGADIASENGAWKVRRSVPVLPESFLVPGDPSSAAFFLCGAAILAGSDVSARRVLLNPTRLGFLRVLERLGAVVEMEDQDQHPEPWGHVRVRFSPELTACLVTGEEIPQLVDEVPILALTATQARGITVFQGVGELRIKESDRLSAIVSQLNVMGARLEVKDDDLTVEGPTPLSAPADLDSFGDHRIAMTLRLAGLLAGAHPGIKGEESTVISYPGFHQELERLLK